MPQFRDFHAAVLVDGVELPEYTIEVSQDDDNISCYIPSEAGKNFAVRWRDLNLQRSTVGIVHLDGVSTTRKSITKGPDGSNLREASTSYYRVGNNTVRPFCFAHLSLTDDEDCANPAENDLGEIRIGLYEFLGSKAVPFPRDWKPEHVPGVVRMHEHSKKAMTHCVGYGDDTKLEAPKNVITSKKGKRLATFIFRYRALDMLQAQGIAPPPPRPVASTKRENKRQRCKEEDTEVIDESDDAKADKAMLKILKAEISKIEARVLKRQKTTVKSEVKSEDKTLVIANEVIELE